MVHVSRFHSFCVSFKHSSLLGRLTLQSMYKKRTFVCGLGSVQTKHTGLGVPILLVEMGYVCQSEESEGLYQSSYHIETFSSYDWPFHSLVQIFPRALHCTLAKRTL